MKDQINSNNTNVQQSDRREVSLGRHKAQCSVCKHPNCKEIEDAWLDWCSLVKIEYAYQISRDSLYRHCHAFGLFSKRRRNIIRAYERIADRWDTVEYNGSNIIAALRDLFKLINAEKAAEATQSADPKTTARQTTAKESKSSAPDGSFAALFDQISGAQPEQGQNEEEEEREKKEEEKEPQSPEPTTVQ